jgi:hypothetical protein
MADVGEELGVSGFKLHVSGLMLHSPSFPVLPASSVYREPAKGPHRVRFGARVGVVQVLNPFRV